MSMTWIWYLGIISNLEIVSSILVDVWRLYASRMPFFCKELEHPQILVTAGQGSGGGGVS